jgi:hypothetical protein
MAAPSILEVSVDSNEYSRYEFGKETITVTLSISGGAPYDDEQVFVDLVKARRSRDAVVATSTVSFTNTADPQQAIVEFYLPDIVDQDLINLVRHGKYFIRATSVTNDNITVDSNDFYISIVTVERLKSDFLFGLDLSATEIKEPKFQPQELEGVTIIQTSKTHPIGVFQLGYFYHQNPTIDATVNIGSGPDGVVTITAVGDFAGFAGNACTVTVQTPAGTSPLTASYAGNELIVNLSVNGGVPETVENTATLVAAAINALDNFNAVASGTGTFSLSLDEGPTLFTGGSTSVVRQMNWDGGPLVSIPTAGTYTLLSGGASAGTSGCSSFSPSTMRDYVIVRITSVLLLSDHNVTESLLIDRKFIDDESLRRYINQSMDWVEKDFLATYVEPTNVVTDRDPTMIQYAAGINAPAPIFSDTDFDFIVSPLTYFIPRTQGQWVQIQTPYPQLLRVDSLYGSIANTRVIDVDLEWIEHSEQAGLIQLVPFNQEIAFDFIGLLWVNALRGAAELPNFWHFNMVVGCRDCSGDIQELIGKKAAIDALVMAGQALRPGLGSVSLARDGVSESVSYINSAKYGMFTGTIQAYKDWITEHGKELRAKYRGITMVVV